MILNQLCGRFKVIILSIIGIFRRALCCFSRRRKQSLSESENLETISVVKEFGQQRKCPDNERDWNSWDDSPRTVEEHIEQYRQKLARPPTPKEPDSEPDFFQDMTPKIKPQPVLFIKTEDQQKTDFSRLEAKVDIPIAVSPDLEDWTEDNNGGWEELNPEETKHLIREKRKELRSQKQQNKLKNSNNNCNNNKNFGVQKITQPQYFTERIEVRQS